MEDLNAGMAEAKALPVYCENNEYLVILYKKIRGLKKKLDKCKKVEERSKKKNPNLHEEQLALLNSKGELERLLKEYESLQEQFEDIAKREYEQEQQKDTKTVPGSDCDEDLEELHSQSQQTDPLQAEDVSTQARVETEEVCTSTNEMPATKDEETVTADIAARLSDIGLPSSEDKTLPKREGEGEATAPVGASGEVPPETGAAPCAPPLGAAAAAPGPSPVPPPGPLPPPGHLPPLPLVPFPVLAELAGGGVARLLRLLHLAHWYPAKAPPAGGGGGGGGGGGQCPPVVDFLSKALLGRTVPPDEFNFDLNLQQSVKLAMTYLGMAHAPEGQVPRVMGVALPALDALVAQLVAELGGDRAPPLPPPPPPPHMAAAAAAAPGVGGASLPPLAPPAGAPAAFPSSAALAPPGTGVGAGPPSGAGAAAAAAGAGGGGAELPSQRLLEAAVAQGGWHSPPSAREGAPAHGGAPFGLDPPPAAVSQGSTIPADEDDLNSLAPPQFGSFPGPEDIHLHFGADASTTPPR